LSLKAVNFAFFCLFDVVNDSDLSSLTQTRLLNYLDPQLVSGTRRLCGTQLEASVWNFTVLLQLLLTVLQLVRHYLVLYIHHQTRVICCQTLLE